MSLRATADTRRSEPVEVAAAELDLTAYVRPGDRLVWGQGPAEPHSLTSALVEQRAAIVGDGERLDIFLAVTLGDSMRAEYAEQFRYFGLGGLGQTSRLTKAGAVEVMPTRLGAVTRLIRSGRLRFDVVLVQLSEPRDGVCSTGLVGDMLQDAIRTARVVIGEINPHVPFSRGDTQVPLRDLDVVVRSDAPLPQWPAARVSPDAQRIAEQIAELVPDGATLQMGIGAIPEAFAAAATGKRDLAIHSGMVGDAVIELVESGAVTNARKPIDTGVSVTGLAFGTERLVRWIDDNPEVVLRSIDHTHGIRPLSALPDLWAINSAIEIDLTGQVNAETMGGVYAGGIGGQLDFVDAAIGSESGRSVIALPSTAARGTVSRIVPQLADGVVTTPRGSADLFVTEYGVADLRGATIAQRAKAMIAIAHPDHRADLERAARTLL